MSRLVISSLEEQNTVAVRTRSDLALSLHRSLEHNEQDLRSYREGQMEVPHIGRVMYKYWTLRDEHTCSCYRCRLHVGGRTSESR